MLYTIKIAQQIFSATVATSVATAQSNKIVKATATVLTAVWTVIYPQIHNFNWLRFLTVLVFTVSIVLCNHIGSRPALTAAQNFQSPGTTILCTLL